MDKKQRDAIPPRKINFDGASNRKPMAPPKDNMFKAAEILAKGNDNIDLDYLRKIVGTAVKQQSKADTARKLASDPEMCVSTARDKPEKKDYRDEQSRTGSSERRRRTRDHQIGRAS